MKRTIEGRGQAGEDGVEQLRDADVGQRRRADQRKQLAGHRPGAQAGDQFVVGEGAGLEELLHELFVAFRDHLDQRFARAVDRRGHVAGHGPFGVGTALVGLEDERLSRDQIDDAAEVLLFPDGQLNRDDGAAARVAQRRQRAIEAGAFAVHPIEHDETRQTDRIGRFPDFFRLHHHARDGVHDYEGGIGDVKRGARVGEEVAGAGRVDEIDFVFVPLGVGEAGRKRVLTRDFFFVEVRDGRAIVHFSEAVDHGGVGEDGGDELGFTGCAVTDERDISDGGGVVDLHNGVPPENLVIGSLGHLAM